MVQKKKDKGPWMQHLIPLKSQQKAVPQGQTLEFSCAKELVHSFEGQISPVWEGLASDTCVGNQHYIMYNTSCYLTTVVWRIHRWLLGHWTQTLVSWSLCACLIHLTSQKTFHSLSLIYDSTLNHFIDAVHRSLVCTCLEMYLHLTAKWIAITVISPLSRIIFSSFSSGVYTGDCDLEFSQ